MKSTREDLAFLLVRSVGFLLLLLLLLFFLTHHSIQPKVNSPAENHSGPCNMSRTQKEKKDVKQPPYQYSGALLTGMII